MKFGSKARARAKEVKEERAKEGATIADQLGHFRESAPSRTRARANAKCSKENVTTAEKLDVQSASAPRTKELKNEPGAREDTKDNVASEGSKKLQRNLAS